MLGRCRAGANGGAEPDTDRTVQGLPNQRSDAQEPGAIASSAESPM